MFILVFVAIKNIYLSIPNYQNFYFLLSLLVLHLDLPSMRIFFTACNCSMRLARNNWKNNSEDSSLLMTTLRHKQISTASPTGVKSKIKYKGVNLIKVHCSMLIAQCSYNLKKRNYEHVKLYHCDL